MLFEFVYNDDGSLVPPFNTLYMTFLDLDGGVNAAEAVKVYGVDEVYLHDNTKLNVIDTIGRLHISFCKKFILLR